MNPALLLEPGRQFCIGLSSEVEIDPGVEVTCSGKFDRPGLVEWLHFEKALVPMDHYSLRVEWMRPTEWKKMGAFWVGKTSEVRELAAGRLTSARVDLCDLRSAWRGGGGLAALGPALVRPLDRIHLQMRNSTRERRRLHAAVWFAEVSRGLLEQSTGWDFGPGRKSGDGE